MALAYATSSFTSFAGTDGCTARMCGEYATIITGAKSLTGSKGRLVNTLGLIASEPMSASISV